MRGKILDHGGYELSSRGSVDCQLNVWLGDSQSPKVSSDDEDDGGEGEVSISQIDLRR